MKRFDFPLERVMTWRETQAKLEEVKLKELRARARQLDQELASMEQARLGAGRTLRERGDATGQELALLDAFQRAADAELARLQRARGACLRAIDEQVWNVIQRRRDAMMLEKLRTKSLVNWSAALARETDREAEEAHLARSYVR